ncbi:hypothetical protein RRG08_054597 [Elysia crispata]|uniref:Uncharacterized protein n=1 Tax=Elysia crispata TaxID=231223 RepID=A0AAE1B1F0_9GAST|nr:hypothetical protein RRG08_054597 [Elysia crispata]
MSCSALQLKRPQCREEPTKFHKVFICPRVKPTLQLSMPGDVTNTVKHVALRLAHSQAVVYHDARVNNEKRQSLSFSRVFYKDQTRFAKHFGFECCFLGDFDYEMKRTFAQHTVHGAKFCIALHG